MKVLGLGVGNEWMAYAGDLPEAARCCVGFVLMCFTRLESSALKLCDVGKWSVLMLFLIDFIMLH